MELNAPARVQHVKGRRTKRHRSSSPTTAVLTVSSSSGESGVGGVVREEHGSVLSSATTHSGDAYEITNPEEEDMANCLIMLAQGDGPRKSEKVSAIALAASSAEPTTHKPGLYLYECKTCNRTFPSFQALGGHRASHKKPKPTTGLPLILFSSSSSDDAKFDEWSTPNIPPLRIGTSSNPSKIPLSNISKSTKVHECSICGSEFNSGQALGGHMRRHRASNSAAATSADQGEPAIHLGLHDGKDQESPKPRMLLSLDLNLPAPEDDHHHHQLHCPRESKFPFLPARRPLLFSATALVDCHY